MYLTKYRIGDETIYRLTKDSTPTNIQVMKEDRVGSGRKVSESLMTHFSMIDKLLKEKPEEEAPPEEKESKKASVASVIRRYVSTLKD